MTCCINSYIWRKLTVIADSYLCHIQNRTVIICKKILTSLNIFSIVAVKRRINKSIVRLTQKLLYHLCNSVKIRPVHKIQFLKNSPAHNLLFKYAFVRNIGKLRISAFPHIHSLCLLFHPVSRAQFCISEYIFPFISP